MINKLCRYKKPIVLVAGGYGVQSDVLKKHKIFKLMVKSAIKNASRILAVSNFTQNEVFKTYFRTTCPVINIVYNGIDTELFKDHKLRDNKKPVALTVGNIFSMDRYYLKGIDRFIDLARKNPQGIFYVIGMHDKVAKNIQNVPSNCHFLTPVPQEALPFFYNIADTYYQLAPDLAFLPLHNELNTKVDAEVINTYCTLVVSTLWKQYARTYDEYIEGLKRVAAFLLLYTGKNVMVLPHSTYESDIQIAKDVADNKHIFALVGEEPMTPSKARSVLANSYLNISLRMHGAISSLESGIPVIAVAYSPKYEGVISKGYDLPKLVIKKRKRKEWLKHTNDEINITIEYVLRHYDEISLWIKNVSLSKTTEITKPLLSIMEKS